MFRQFARAEPGNGERKQADEYTFFTINGIKTMGDIVPFGAEYKLEIIGDYARSPTAIYKALTSSDEPALFFGTRTKWCAYVSGRYITSNQATKFTVSRRNKRLLPENDDTWDICREFLVNLPRSSTDPFMKELIEERKNELRRLAEAEQRYNVEKREEEEEERLDMEDEAQLGRIPEELRQKVIDMAENLSYGHKRPFAQFVEHYLANPGKLEEFGIFELLEHPEYWTIEWPYVPTFKNLLSKERTDMDELTGMSREQIMALGEISGKRGKDGLTFIVQVNETEYAVKTFDSDFPWRIIQREACLQEKAASVGVSPKLYSINTREKYIIMEKMQETIVDYAHRENPVGADDKRKWWTLPDVHQKRIIDIMYKLDEVDVLHNDGNPLNLMFDDNGQLMVIDFGLSKLIDDAIIAKRGPHPNIDLTLWHFQRKLRHYKIKTPILKDTIEEYTKSQSK